MGSNYVFIRISISKIITRLQTFQGVLSVIRALRPRYNKLYNIRMKIEPRKIRNPNELLQVLKEIKFLVSNNDIQFIKSGSESWDFHNEEIVGGQWPDFFSNKYFDKSEQANYVLSCDTYHGNCKIRKEGGDESWISRLFK